MAAQFISKDPFFNVNTKLPVGIHFFQLEVMDDKGKKSKPAVVKIKIVKKRTNSEKGG